MKKGMPFIFAIAFSLALIGLVSAEIKINEVMPHTNNSLHDDWVELYNGDSFQVNLTNWIISDGTGNKTFNLSIPASSFGLIVDDNIDYNGSTGCQAVYALLNNSNFNCFQLSVIGSSGLNADAESVILYNGSQLISNFSWTTNIQSKGLSWSYNGSSWLNCTPTPGSANNCTSQSQSPTCPAGYTCTNSSCANNIITQTCINATANCTNMTLMQNFSCSSSNNSGLYIELSWTDDEIINGKEFEADVKAYNLGSYDYDIKVWLEFYSNSTIISERYDGADDGWKSGTYYISKFFTGSGNKTKSINLRVKDDYNNFYGDAKIFAKIRKNGDSDVLDDYESTIELLEEASSDSQNSSDNAAVLLSNTTNSAASASNNAGGIIVLGGGGNNSSSNSTSQAKNSMVYKSKSEYIKEYAPYAFGLLCIFLIIMLLIEKTRAARTKTEND